MTMTSTLTPPPTATPKPAAPATKIAYTMSRFPKVTETFIVREMLELERQGVQVEVFPLRRENAKLVQSEAQRFVDRAHFTPMISAAIVLANVRALLTQPLNYLGTLATLIRANLGSPRFLSGALAFFPKAVYLAETMRKQGIGHLHAHFASHPAAVAYVIGRLSGIPYSFTAHGSDLHRDQHMLHEKTSEAAFVVAISQYNRDIILKVSGEEHAAKVHVVHCGIDPTRFSRRTSPTAYDLGEGPFRIVCVGTLHEVKGQTYLIEACRLLSARGIKLECHFLGEGADREQLQAQAAAAGLNEQMVFHGSCTSAEVREQMAAADCLVAPSVPSRDGRREGIPVVLMEAMGTGLPCISSQLSGIPELVVHNRSGYLTQPGDAPAIADALERLATNAELRRSFGAAGVEIVLQDFHAETNCKTLATLFPANHSSSGEFE